MRYQGAGNYLLFELTDKELAIKNVAGGKQSPVTTLPHNLKRDEFDISITVQPDTIAVRISADGVPETISWRSTKGSLTEGQFGIRGDTWFKNFNYRRG